MSYESESSQPEKNDSSTTLVATQNLVYVLFGGARSRIANDWQTGRRHQRCDASRHQLEGETLVLKHVYGCVDIWLKCVTSLIAGNGAQVVLSFIFFF